MNYAYIRFSTDKQDERQQMNSIENYLRGKGIQIGQYVKDEGVSGGVTYKKRKLYGLVQKMKAGDALIVSEASRLGRSMADLNRLVNDELRPRGVRLIIINMGFDVDCSQIKAIDEIMLSFFGFAAQLEKELIQERTRNGLQARKKAGKAIGGTNELWGKVTGASRKEAVTAAAVASAQARRERAKKDPANLYFKEFMEDWKESGRKLDWDAISEKLNERGRKTATGLPFTPTRARGMYEKTRKLYQKNYIVCDSYLQ